MPARVLCGNSIWRGGSRVIIFLLFSSRRTHWRRILLSLYDLITLRRIKRYFYSSACWVKSRRKLHFVCFQLNRTPLYPTCPQGVFTLACLMTPVVCEYQFNRDLREKWDAFSITPKCKVSAFDLRTVNGREINAGKSATGVASFCMLLKLKPLSTLGCYLIRLQLTYQQALTCGRYKKKYTHVHKFKQCVQLFLFIAIFNKKVKFFK